jgi:hypothetical protein
MVAAYQLSDFADATGNTVEDRTVCIYRQGLVKAGDLQFLPAFDRSVVGCNASFQDFEKRGLSAAVATHEADALTGFD